MGVIAVMLAVVWATFLAGLLAVRFDAWITRAHDRMEDQAESRRVVPTSLLVAAGVAATEALRVMRWAVILWAVLQGRGIGGEIIGLALLALLALWLLDTLTSYGAVGLPMIRGDLAREARMEAERVTIRLESMRGEDSRGNAVEGGRLSLEQDEGPGA